MLPGLVYWSSTSGNTQRFVQALGFSALCLPNQGPVPLMDRPFVLMTPTYAAHDGRGAVPKPVIRFLNEPQNRGLIKGVIGAGNRNFGALFAQGATVVAQKCNVPVLYRFELAGTIQDVEIVRRGLKAFLPDAFAKDDRQRAPIV